MALVNLRSDLSRIRRKFGSNTRTAGRTQATKRVGVERGLSNVTLPRTNMMDSNGNVQINYDEGNKFQVPLDRSNSKLEIHWDDAKDSYYAKGPTNDILGLKKESRLGSPNQPYVIREIGQRWDGSDEATIGNTVDFFRGGASTIAGRVAGDYNRLNKFLGTSEGKFFQTKQFGLQLLNVGGDLGERANIYNPISALLNTVPLLHFKRHVDIPIASDLIRKKLVGNLPDGQGFGSDKDSARYKKTTAASALLNFIGIGGDKPHLSDIEGTKVVRGIDDKSWGDRVNLVPYGQKTQADITAAEKDDFIPFRFKDVNNNKYIIFRALLSGIADNITPEYSSTRYVGRPDQVHVYQGTNREISFTFDVYPKTEQELPVLWEKLNYLVGLVYPSWAPSSSGFGMIAPFIELTIGDMYKDTPGFLSQLSLTVQDGTTWEIKDWKLPKYIQASCSFTYVGKYLPNQIGKHYELDWLTNSNTPLGTFTKATDHYPRRSETKPALGTKRDRLVKLFGNLGQVWDKETPFIS